MAVDWEEKKAELVAALLAVAPDANAAALEAVAEALSEWVESILDDAEVSVSGTTHGEAHVLSGAIS